MVSIGGIALFGGKMRENRQNECLNYTDKNLTQAVTVLQDKFMVIQKKYPNCPKPNINFGLRGTRYFIEFPIAGKNIDAFGLLVTT